MQCGIDRLFCRLVSHTLYIVTNELSGMGPNRSIRGALQDVSPHFQSMPTSIHTLLGLLQKVVGLSLSSNSLRHPRSYINGISAAYRRSSLIFRLGRCLASA